MTHIPAYSAAMSEYEQTGFEEWPESVPPMPRGVGVRALRYGTRDPQWHVTATHTGGCSVTVVDADLEAGMIRAIEELRQKMEASK